MKKLVEVVPSGRVVSKKLQKLLENSKSWDKLGIASLVRREITHLSYAF